MKNECSDMDLYTKTLISKIAVESGTDKHNELVEMKIKVPVKIAKAIIGCTQCHAEYGDIEAMFDIFCKNVFLKGLQAVTMELFETKEKHAQFVNEILSIKKCNECLHKGAGIENCI